MMTLLDQTKDCSIKTSKIKAREINYKKDKFCKIKRIAYFQKKPCWTSNKVGAQRIPVKGIRLKDKNKLS